MASDFAACRGCEAVLYTALRHIDGGELDAALEHFASDATVVRAGELLDGRDAIGGMLRARPAGRETRHHCTNLAFTDTSPDKVSASCYLVLYIGTHDGGEDAINWAPASLVDYVVEFSSKDSGWVIQRLEIRPVAQL